MNDNLEETPEQQYERELRERYRAIFGTPIGRAVLTDILLGLCHFCGSLDPDNAAQIAEYNVGVAIAAKAGLLEDIQRYLGLLT